LYGYIYKDKKNYIYNLKFGKLAAKIIVGEIYYKKALCLNRKNEKKLSLLKDESKMKNYANVICSDVGTGRQSGLKIQ
jgi:hypothetical protein